MNISKFSMVLLLCITISLVLVPDAPANSGKIAAAIRAWRPITIDGNLNDWIEPIAESDWHGRLQAKKGKFIGSMEAAPEFLNITTSVVEKGVIHSSRDFSAVFYFMWDEEKLYFAAMVQDNELVTRFRGADIWQDDCIEVWLDLRHDALTNKLKQDDEYQIGFSPASKARLKPEAWVWRNPYSEPVREALEYASSETDDGYIIEAAIPFKVLKGAKPEIGKIIGVNVSGCDKDEVKEWSHSIWSGKLHSDPTQFGDLLFIDAPVELSPEILKK